MLGKACFESTDSTGATGIDTIADFSKGADTIDLVAIDAISSTALDDPFVLIFAAAF